MTKPRRTPAEAAMSLLLAEVGAYALKRGEAWRTHEGIGLMDAYQNGMEVFQRMIAHDDKPAQHSS